jgi:exonuclease III
MAHRNCRILNWNVRGLNNYARRDVICDLVRDTGVTIVCLQETKLQDVDAMMVTRTIGHNFANSFATLSASQTRGGILLAIDESFFDLSNIHLSSHAVTATISMRADATQWQITVVYEPQSDGDKMQFLQELKNINPPSHGRWLILGDFNLI